MERYFYEDARVPDRGGDPRFLIYDRVQGMGASRAIAVCTDVDVAQRIVGLLNADELIRLTTRAREMELKRRLRETEIKQREIYP